MLLSVPKQDETKPALIHDAGVHDKSIFVFALMPSPLTKGHVRDDECFHGSCLDFHGQVLAQEIQKSLGPTQP